MSVLENLIGPSISEFSNEHFPTLRNVLQFYSQFWGNHGSESQRERLVAEKLIGLYDRINTPTISEKGIMNQIGRNVNKMRLVLKSFQAKVKSPATIKREYEFHLTLDEIFEIRQWTQSSDVDEPGNQDDLSSVISNSMIEIDDTYGNFFKKFIISQSQIREFFFCSAKPGQNMSSRTLS